MTDGNRVDFVGDEAAFADLRRWADQLPGEFDKAIVPFVDRLAEQVRSVVPRLSGQLAGSVTSSALADGVGLSMGDGLAYAGWIEFGGTRGRPYVPEGRYVYPTALASVPDLEEFASDAAADTVREFSWSTP